MPISNEEWHEMDAIRQAINEHLPSVHFSKMERFSELFVQTLMRQERETQQQNQ